MSKRPRHPPPKIATRADPGTEDRKHHLTSVFEPQTPTDSDSSDRPRSPPTPWKPVKPAPYLAWATNPLTAIKLLCVPVVLYYNWELVASHVSPLPPNPFRRIFDVSGYVEGSSPEDPRYAKTWWDFAFLAYYVVFFSAVRQLLCVSVAGPIARYMGLRRQGKIERFGEQFYALVYFTIFGAWGYRVMQNLPSYWYETKNFWVDYPHWRIRPDLKRYYLTQAAYWLQQFLVLLLGLEKPRKDYWELVAHHFVTLWLIGWSYLVNLTYIGNAVYVSMDIPDAFLAASKLLNYIKWTRTKIVSFAVFILVWTYFRHYLNLKILYSTIAETDLIPAYAHKWDWSEGVYFVWWLPLAIFASIGALQILNLFWYYLMWRILLRALITKDVDDERSDDEDDADEDDTGSKKDD